MERPNVESVLKMSENNFEFHVYAYRKLNYTELVSVLKIWMRNERRKKLPKTRLSRFTQRLGCEHLRQYHNLTL